MAKPDPQGGLVIRYDYLWLWEKDKGRVQGSKDRPCALVVAIPGRSNKPLRALVCGITHIEPTQPDDGVEIPPKVKAHLGLDFDRSWIVTSEANIVEWDDPGIIPTPSGKWAYGFLPPSLADRVSQAVLTRHNESRLNLIDRGPANANNQPNSN